MTDSFLSLDSIARVFKDGTGLQETSIDIAEGQFVSILGPSGCGKSTLLRCVAGLESPDSGTIRLAGTEVFGPGVNVPPSKRGLSMVFQDLALWPHMSVRKNIEFPLTTATSKVPASERAGKVDRVMEMVGISNKADARPNQLSGGQQQRVAIARALVSEPKLVLMDEPLSALDAALRAKIRAELVELTKNLGLTVLYVTHDQSEAMSMSDRVLVMNEGRIRQDAAPQTIYEHPADEFVGNFVGTMNTLPDGAQVRPERVRIASEGQLTGTVTSVRYVGGHFDVGVDVGSGNPWLVYAQSDPGVGSTVALAIN